MSLTPDTLGTWHRANMAYIITVCEDSENWNLRLREVRQDSADCGQTKFRIVPSSVRTWRERTEQAKKARATGL